MFKRKGNGGLWSCRTGPGSPFFWYASFLYFLKRVVFVKWHVSFFRIYAFAGSAWQMLFADMMFWICTLGNGEFSPTGFSTVPLYAWLSLAYLILFGSLMAYSAYVWLLKIRPTTEVGTHAYVNPVVAVVIGGGLGGEQITGIQLLGLVIILGSVMLVNKKERINE